MRSPESPLLVALCIALGTLGGGCEACSDEGLATVRQATGEVQRDHAGAEDRWEAAPEGTELGFGDGLRTGPEARALLGLDAGGRLRLGPSSRVRLGRGSRGHAVSVSVLDGELELEAGNDSLQVETLLGPLVLDPGGRARLGGSSLTVVVGSATLERGGESRSLSAGDRIDLEFGSLELEPSPPGPVGDPVDEPPADPTSRWTVTAEDVGVQVRDDEDATWRSIAAGASAAADAAELTVDPGGTARLARGADDVALSDAAAAAVDPSGGPVRLDRGRARVEATQGAVVIRVPGGSIVVRGDTPEGGVAIVRRDGAITHVTAERGQVRVRRGDEEEAMEVGSETQVIASDEEAAEAAEAAGGTASAVGPTEVRARTGESFAIHTPSPPAMVELPVPEECGGQGVLELVARRGGRRVEGAGTLRVRLPVGGHRYVVRCRRGAPPVARGRVRVRRDHGARPLPRTAPASRVDLDGRRYTILYQNLMPQVRVQAPGGRSDTLEVRSRGGRVRRVRMTGGVAQLEPGVLTEGSHELRLASAPPTSPPTTVTVRFDNAAPSVTLREPRDGSFSAGEQVTVSGMALPGWSVSVNGRGLAQDMNNRFSEAVQVPAGAGGIAVRLAHPRHGVRYYVRRTREAQ